MKIEKFAILLSAAVMSVAGCYASGTDAGSNPENFLGQADRQTVGDYFKAALEGNDAACTVNRKLAAGEIDEAASAVWQLWKQANARFDEERLPAPTPLEGDPKTKEFNGTWKLLGDEQMHFYYGYKGDKPAEGYPLFLCIHGSGDNNREIMATLSWALRYEDAPSLYFIPRSPKGAEGCRWYQPTRQQAWERVLRQAYLAGDIDPNRVYVFGISEGGYGSQRLGSFYADYLAGAGPIAGGDQMFWAPPENCASIAYCMQTGENDTMYGRKVLTERAMAQWDSLQQAHPGYYVHKIDLQPDKGHNCNYTYTTPYLVQHTRNPYPKYVYWENLPQGNINGEGAAFRSGFYNLRVLERSTDDSNDFVRSCYEMNIDGNNVDLKVNVVTIKPSNWTESEEGWKMNLGEIKTYEKATSGRVIIYLNDKLVDLSKPVTVTVNGKTKFRGKLKPNLKNLVESCAEYFDPMRLYPAAVEVAID